MICAGAVSSCTEKNTTAPDLGFLRLDPRTVEVLIPFEDFVDDVQVFGGYGSAQDLGYGAVALDFDGLNARALVHLLVPTLEQSQSLRYGGGRFVLVFDTVNGSLDVPVDVELFSVEEDWHPPTVTWEMAVDSAGDPRSWTQPGGGSTTLLGAGTFDPLFFKRADSSLALVDTLSLAVDSAEVAALIGAKGLLVAAAEPGVLLRLVNLRLELLTVPILRPDTILEFSARANDLSFMVDPMPAAPVGWLRVGGAPSWRSVMTMSIPRTVDGTVESCGTVGCQVDLTVADLNRAELVLTTRQTELAFQPEDNTTMDLRAVLNPELLPKSPLGEQLLPLLESVPPELFSVQAGTQVIISMTTFVAEILLDAAVTGTVPSASLALLSASEPNMFGFASFEGGGGAGAPVLRLVYTTAAPLGLP